MATEYERFPASVCCVCVRPETEDNEVALISVTTEWRGGPSLIEQLCRLCPSRTWLGHFRVCDKCAAALCAACAFLDACVASEAAHAAAAVKTSPAEDSDQEIEDEVKEESNSDSEPDGTFEENKSGWTCSSCGKEFRLERSLKAHRTRVHGGADGGPKIGKTVSFPCLHCGAMFGRRQHLEAHVRARHTLERPYVCEGPNGCGAAFSTSHSLLVHRRRHAGERSYVCAACGKRFVCSGDLYHHSKIHLDKREYACAECGKRFNTTSVLRTHRIVKHTAPAQWHYACGTCARRFPIRSSLAAHERRHAGDRPHQCRACPKKFFSRPELLKHEAAHGGDATVRPFVCAHADCVPPAPPRAYRTQDGLRRHQRTAHPTAHQPPPQVLTTLHKTPT